MKPLDLIENDLNVIDLDFKGPEVRNFDFQIFQKSENELKKQY